MKLVELVRKVAVVEVETEELLSEDVVDALKGFLKGDDSSLVRALSIVVEKLEKVVVASSYVVICPCNKKVADSLNTAFHEASKKVGKKVFVQSKK